VTIGADDFRVVMRRLTAGVTVLTTSYDGQVHGMTATAVCSVSADPPTVLAVVNRTARTHPLIDRSATFAVNILAEDQEALGRRFAGQLVDQFDGIPYHLGTTGCPIIEGTTAYLECHVVSRHEAGTHTIFVANPVASGLGPESPLLYHDGHYAALAPRPE